METQKTRKKIIKKTCKKLQNVIENGLEPFEIPTTISINGNYGTVINFNNIIKEHKK